jgi:hypothetical protein
MPYADVHFVNLSRGKSILNPLYAVPQFTQEQILRDAPPRISTKIDTNEIAYTLNPTRRKEMESVYIRAIL